MSDKMRFYILGGIIVLVVLVFYLGITAEQNSAKQGKGSGSLDQSLSLPAQTELNGKIAGESVQVPHDKAIDNTAIAPEMQKSLLP